MMTDRWLENHLSVFLKEETDAPIWIKRFGELMMLTIITRRSTTKLSRTIKALCSRYIEQELYTKKEYVQVSKILQLYLESFEDTSYDLKIPSVDFSNSEISQLEILCYDALLRKENPSLTKLYRNTQLYEETIIKRLPPSFTDIYLHTHCIFYISLLGKRRIEKDFDRQTIRNLIEYFRQLLVFAVKIDYYDLVAELLLCLHLLGDDLADFLELKKIALSSLNYFVSCYWQKQARSDEFSDIYHTILSINMLCHKIREDDHG